MTDDETVLAVDATEAARRLSFPAGQTGTAGKQKVLKLVRDGRLRGVLIGKTIRIPVSELHRFLDTA